MDEKLDFEYRRLLSNPERVREPLGQLSPQPWMTWPETQAVVAALRAEGTEVRFVGGCVRDAMAHKPVKDIDIATPDPPEKVVALIGAAGLRAIPTGIEHGTITAISGERTFEVTTLRRDVRAHGRRADVEWTADWLADAARRDFTINAMSATPEGAVYDYFDGIDHLAHGQILFVGRPMDRIREDYLRILRFFRFFARFGRPPADHDALKACEALREGLRDLSGERVRDELLRILETDAAPAVLVMMAGEGVLDVVLPEAKALGRLRQMVFFETRGLRLDTIEPDPLRRLGSMLTGGPQAAEAVADRLRLSNAERDRLIGMTNRSEVPTPELSSGERHALLYRLNRERALDLVLIEWAEAREIDLRKAGGQKWLPLVEELATMEVPDFPLKGRDLASLGHPPGPAMGRLLRDLEGWWLSHGTRPDRDALLIEAGKRFGK